MGSVLTVRESREEAAERLGITQGPPEFHYDPPNYVELDPPPSYSEHMHNNEDVQTREIYRDERKNKRFICFCFNGVLK